jgi:hypothetical protein
VCGLNSSDFPHDIFIVGRQTTDTRQVGDGLVELAPLDQVSRGFVLHEGEEENQTGEDDVKRRGNKLFSVNTWKESVVTNIHTQRLCVVSPRLSSQP